MRPIYQFIADKVSRNEYVFFQAQNRNAMYFNLVFHVNGKEIHFNEYTLDAIEQKLGLVPITPVVAEVKKSIPLPPMPPMPTPRMIQ